MTSSYRAGMAMNDLRRSVLASETDGAKSSGLLARLVEQIYGERLAAADVRIGDKRPQDIQILDDRFYRASLGGLYGLREAYVDNYWDVDSLDDLTYRLIRSEVGRVGNDGASSTLGSRWSNVLRSTLSRRFFKVADHYDLGNDLFELMLDPRMIYSCAYWSEGMTLAEAQEAKLDLVCRKLGLRPGMRVLDIGCGWGGFARFAAERYGVSVVGITISRQQIELGQKVCHGLPVELRLQDYRDLSRGEQFDAVVSIGMFEHVQRRNHRTYMKVVRRAIRPDGLFLLQTIGCRVPGESGDLWINRHVFDGMLPTPQHLATAFEGLFVLENWQNLGTNYDRTLMAWHANFQSGWEHIAATYGPRFRRFWSCYLLTCAGAFRARTTQIWQLVLSPNGVSGGWPVVI